MKYVINTQKDMIQPIPYRVVRTRNSEAKNVRSFIVHSTVYVSIQKSIVDSSVNNCFTFQQTKSYPNPIHRHYHQFFFLHSLLFAVFSNASHSTNLNSRVFGVKILT